MANDATITLRLPVDDLDRADELVPLLEQVPTLRAARVSRSLVLRLALATGLDALEQEYKLGGPSVSARARRERPAKLRDERTPVEPAAEDPPSVFTKAYQRPSRRSEPKTEAGAALRAWREGIPLTQHEAGERLGLGQTTLSRFETGKTLPSKGQAERIEQVTGIPAADWSK